MRSIITLWLLLCAAAVQSQPVITTHPQGQSDIPGASITLSVAATGSGSLTYQWRMDESPLPNKTNATLVITNFGSSNVGGYDVMLTDLSGSVTSDVASLTLESDEYIFTTIAGLATNYGTFDGVGTSARFSGNLRGIAVDSTGNIYVADAGRHTIRKITPGGEVSTLAGLAGVAGSVDGTNGAARFNTPCGIAVDNTGTVFVAAFGNHTVRKITADGIVTTLAGKAGVLGSADGVGTNATFLGPNGLTLDDAGNLFVTEFTGPGLQHPIRKITPAGVVSTLTNIFQPAVSPAGLAFDSNGNLFVAEEYQRPRIWQIEPSGSFGIFAGSTNGFPGYMDGSRDNARFTAPWGVAVDGLDNIIVADRESNIIRKISPNGVVSTMAGRGGSTGSTDGAASEARFYWPWSVAFDSAGALYVADGNGTIRKGVRYTGAPFIITQPLCQSVAPGSNVTFSITVTSAAPVSCQWRFNGEDLSGETNLSLTVTNIQLDNLGNYQASVSNASGLDASVLASLGLLGQPLSFLSGPNDIEYDTNGLRLQLTGLVGQGQIIVYASTNLADWDAIYTNTAGFGNLSFTDPAATNFTRRFYRATVPATP